MINIEMTIKYFGLEEKVCYRLIKVIYVLSLVIGFILTVYAGYFFKPFQYINIEDSYLVCPHGIHSLKSADLYIQLNSMKLDAYYDTKAKSICLLDESNQELKYDILSNGITPSLARSELLRREMARQPASGIFYKLQLNYRESGSWSMAIIIWAMGTLLIFLLLNIAKQTTLYVVYGKKFSFSL